MDPEWVRFMPGAALPEELGHDASAQISDAVTTFRERSGHVTPGVQSGVRASEQVGQKLQA
jgi:hypothetical protein